MPSRPIVLDSLIADLRKVETWLTTSLGVAVDGSDDRETPDPFSPPDDLACLKAAIDRIRPLLWVYTTRQNESREVNKGNRPASVRSLMEEALSISDRYVGKE
jgi:hypothetical protein